MADKELIAGRKKEKNDIFSSKPVIFLISLFFSLAIWCVVSMYETPETDRVFQDVKVQMNLTDTVPGLLDMTVFGTNEFYCDVTVNGKSYLVNDTSFTSDKIIVKPKLEDIRTPGIYEVELTAQLINASAELSVVSVEPKYITVYFDTAVEKEFDLILVGADDYTVAENCVIDSMTLRPSTVLAVGPSLEMNYIREIRANVSFSEPISSTTQHPVTLEFVADGKTINYTTVKEQENLYLDVQVSIEKTYEAKVDFVNAPEGLDLENLISCSLVDYGKTLTLYVPTESESLMAADSITVGRIDMSAIAFSSRQTVTAERYNRSIFYDVLPESFEVSLTLNTDMLVEQSISVPVVYNGENSQMYTFAETVENVIIICDAEKVLSLDLAKIYAQPNDLLLNKLESGEQTVDVLIVLPGDCDYAWVAGKYSTAVTVSE
ncbi:MAG: hypothetical protein E7523_02015 [Ruminococcaceae bacterium]|nr:hypothetical protein [Oscillospiraceae bacterium]